MLPTGSIDVLLWSSIVVKACFAGRAIVRCVLDNDGVLIDCVVVWLGGGVTISGPIEEICVMLVDWEVKELGEVDNISGGCSTARFRETGEATSLDARMRPPNMKIGSPESPILIITTSWGPIVGRVAEMKLVSTEACCPHD